MKFSIALLFGLAIGQLPAVLYAQVPPKLRVMVLTDIEADPDDAQSLVRYLTYANGWENT